MLRKVTAVLQGHALVRLYTIGRRESFGKDSSHPASRLVRDEMGPALVQTPHLQTDAPLVPGACSSHFIGTLLQSPMLRSVACLVIKGTILLLLRVVLGAQNFQYTNCHLAERQYWAFHSLTPRQAYIPLPPSLTGHQDHAAVRKSGRASSPMLSQNGTSWPSTRLPTAQAAT
ncbi:hypothetical protein FIBSPDRAFT_938207 [Athelia psychrophila]|uniref:Uncharacterized protein n=1 Tax=Athelia psychrophila TaxID=1759441 RepID=A0A165Z186_9AGAM|nr:hypothetical protein FIBSPDRAFT_938207 [Fibularhizoctonia sp. CBS 109695]